jgi:hypothetical protein
MLVEAVLCIEDMGVALFFATADKAEFPVPKSEEIALGYVVVELETCALWSDTPEVVVVALGAKVDATEALDMGFAVGKAEREETRPATSASSM